MIIPRYPQNYFITRQSILKKMPDHLIYRDKSISYSNLSEDCFWAFSLKKPSEKAILYCYPEKTYRKDMGWVKSLYISYLDTFGSSDKGLGTSLLNFARKYSEYLGLEGRIHLDSSGSKSPDRVPHIFYRKYGMNTGRPRVDRELDSFIASGKDATYLDFETMPMFYPPIQYGTKDSTPIFKRIVQSISHFFSLSNKVKQ